MKVVYLAKECYYNGCDIWKTVITVFDSYEKVSAWILECQSVDNETEWREYEMMEVE